MFTISEYDPYVAIALSANEHTRLRLISCLVSLLITGAFKRKEYLTIESEKRGIIKYY